MFLRGPKKESRSAKKVWERGGPKARPKQRPKGRPHKMRLLHARKVKGREEKSTKRTKGRKRQRVRADAKLQILKGRRERQKEEISLGKKEDLPTRF